MSEYKVKKEYSGTGVSKDPKLINSTALSEKEQQIYENALKEGMNKAWEAAQTICCGMTLIPYGKLAEIFETGPIYSNAEIINRLTPEDAIERIEKYRQSQIEDEE